MNTNENTDLNRAMTEKVVGVLDQSIDELDELSLQRLKNARMKARSQDVERKRAAWIPLGAAASIAVLLLSPIAWYQYAPKSNLNNDYPIAIQDAPIDQQELDDVDMLMSLVDSDA